MIDFKKALAKLRAEQNGTTVGAELEIIRGEDALRDANGGYLPREDVPFMHGEGVRTNCIDGRSRTVPLVFEITWGGGRGNEPVFKIAEGGVTGSEGFVLDECEAARLGTRGWTANTLCAGRYDGLHVSAETMARVRAFVDDALHPAAASAPSPYDVSADPSELHDEEWPPSDYFEWLGNQPPLEADHDPEWDD